MAQLAENARWLGATIAIALLLCHGATVAQERVEPSYDVTPGKPYDSKPETSPIPSFFDQRANAEVGFGFDIEELEIGALPKIEMVSGTTAIAGQIEAGNVEIQPMARPEFPGGAAIVVPPSPVSASQTATPELILEPIVVEPVAGCGCATPLRGRTRIGRFLDGVYQGICNPDPCYQPRWTMLANASVFTEALRPQNRQRLRWDFNNGYGFPDRAEYLWGQSGVKGPGFENSIDFHELSYYVETGSDKFSFFVNTPYRSIYLESGGHTAGFADLSTGTKTLLHDTDLLQVALQFETHVPSGNFLKGLGNGHVALEPALLLGIQLSPRSYLQTQISEWIPIGGTPDFQGALLKYSASYNRTLWGRVDDTSLIGTFEYSGMSFQAGGVSTGTGNPGPSVSTNNVNFGQLGGGIRLNICNRFNIGFATQVGLNDESPSAAYRTEIQFRH